MSKKPPRILLDTSAVKVVPIVGKGTGVIAVRTIPPNSILYYIGKEITTEEFNLLTNQNYVIYTGRSNIYFDANPELPEYDPQGWIAGRINEPSLGSRANMYFIISRDRRTGLSYPALITTKLIVPQEELTFCYGASYRRSYSRGTCAVRPKWL